MSVGRFVMIFSLNLFIYLFMYLSIKRELESGIGESPVMCTTIRRLQLDDQEVGQVILVVVYAAVVDSVVADNILLLLIFLLLHVLVVF